MRTSLVYARHAWLNRRRHALPGEKPSIGQARPSTHALMRPSISHGGTRRAPGPPAGPGKDDGTPVAGETDGRGGRLGVCVALSRSLYPIACVAACVGGAIMHGRSVTQCLCASTRAAEIIDQSHLPMATPGRPTRSTYPPRRLQCARSRSIIVHVVRTDNASVCMPPVWFTPSVYVCRGPPSRSASSYVSGGCSVDPSGQPPALSRGPRSSRRPPSYRQTYPTPTQVSKAMHACMNRSSLGRFLGASVRALHALH